MNKRCLSFAGTRRQNTLKSCEFGFEPWLTNRPFGPIEAVGKWSCGRRAYCDARSHRGLSRTDRKTPSSSKPAGGGKTACESNRGGVAGRKMIRCRAYEGSTQPGTYEWKYASSFCTRNPQDKVGEVSRRATARKAALESWHESATSLLQGIRRAAGRCWQALEQRPLACVDRRARKSDAEFETRCLLEILSDVQVITIPDSGRWWRLGAHRDPDLDQERDSATRKLRCLHCH